MQNYKLLFHMKENKADLQLSTIYERLTVDGLRN